MHSGGSPFRIKPVTDQGWQSRRTGTGADQSISGSMGIDFSDPFYPNRAGNRQTQTAVLRGTTTHPLRAPHNAKHLPLWNQSIAAIVRHDARLLKFVEAGWERGRGSMATLSGFFASLLYGVFCEIHKTQDAVFMA